MEEEENIVTLSSVALRKPASGKRGSLYLESFSLIILQSVQLTNTDTRPFYIEIRSLLTTRSLFFFFFFF